MTGPLSGLKVLDLSRILAGPYCTMLLADMGADVVKVEAPGTGDDTRAWGPPFLDGESIYFLSINRNKRSMVLDLKNPAGKGVLEDLVRSADILIENFRPRTMSRLGLGYEHLKTLNSRLIYGAISGFGLTGPMGTRPGYDLIAQGMGGFMGITGEEGGGPLKVGLPVADINAGMFLAMGVLAALTERDRSGEGQMVDTSLFEGQIAQLTYQAQRYFASGRSPGPEGNVHPLIAPYQTFKAQDGSLNMACGNNKLFAIFCRLFDKTSLIDDPRFVTNSDRVMNRKALTEIIESLFARRPVEDLLVDLELAGIPCGPIWPLETVLNSEQALAREMVVELEHPKLGSWKCTGVPMKFSRTPGSVRTPPPALGAHQEDVLMDWLDRDRTQRDDLTARGAFGD